MGENEKLGTCRHCGAEITKADKTCPKCFSSTKKPLYQQPWFILSFIVVLFAFIISTFFLSVEDKNESESTVAVANSEKKTDLEVSEDITETSESEITEEETTEVTEIVEENIPFEEIIVTDDENCVIKVTELNLNGDWGPTVKAYFENKSTDVTYVFNIEDASINGVKCDPYFLTEVIPGKKSNNEITFDVDVLEENGITEFTDIEIIFNVYDAEDWSDNYVVYETVHIYPYGEDKATTFVREPQESDIVLFDNEYATAIITSFENDTAFDEYVANLYVINKMDNRAYISVSDSSVNGFMVYTYILEDIISKGNSAFTSLSWDNLELEENGITSIEEIEFLFEVSDYDVWEYTPYVSEVITLSPYDKEESKEF